MVKYLIKTFSNYIIEADDNQEAINCFESGLYDINDLIDETGIELGYYDENDEYHVLKED